MPAPTVPTEVKERRGTLRGDRLPENPIVPQKLNTIPKAPKKYSDRKDLKSKWKEVCNHLLNESRLNEADMDIVELYVDSWGQYNDAVSEIEKLKEEEKFVRIQTNQAGQDYEALTVWWRVQKDAKEEIRKLANDLGLSPAARTKVGGGRKAGSENPAESLFASMFHGHTRN